MKGKTSLILTEFVLLARNVLWWSGLVCRHLAWTCSGRTCDWQNWPWQVWGHGTEAPWSQTATRQGKAKQKTSYKDLTKTNARTYKKPITNLGSAFFVVFQHSITLLNNSHMQNECNSSGVTINIFSVKLCYMPVYLLHIMYRRKMFKELMFLEDRTSNWQHLKKSPKWNIWKVLCKAEE